MADSPFDPERLAALFELERRARGAADATALRFLVVNESRTLVDYRHAALLEPVVGGWHVTALADVPGVDRSTSFVQWLERVAGALPSPEGASMPVSAGDVPEWERETWQALSPPQGLLVALAPPEGEPVAWLWCAREQPWGDTDRFLLEHLGEVYGHALGALLPRGGPGRLRRWLRRRALWIGVAAVLIAVLAIPVRLTALAPTEIVARDPTIVASPLDGVVREVLVEPNARVEAGDPLVRFEDLEARNRYEVARESLEVARSRYRRAQQEAFDNAESRARLATLAAEVELRRTELRFAREKLDKVTLQAEHGGVAVFDDRDEWSGRPVRTGERIMQLANPNARKLRIDLPVEDALVLESGAGLRLFLDARPLDPVRGEIVRAAYQPVVTGQDRMVYRVTGRLTEERPYLRIGLRGTARIEGPRVALAYYLFRRPLTALRQMVGL
ncbi:MAG: biotin/lipoyl-binding protein [Halofilum sp. (in: g-proteobacteria)]|nr:biotin/lipoyl-binding protein [Halofilum sp. (in: g-proteobacteria)]